MNQFFSFSQEVERILDIIINEEDVKLDKILDEMTRGARARVLQEMLT